MRPAVIFAMVVLAACGAPESGRESAALPDRIVLTYADDPPTTQSVSWRMPNGVAEGVAEITRAFGNFDRSDSGRGDGNWDRGELLAWCRSSRFGELSLGQLVDLASLGLRLRPGDMVI